jgi:hypothetical protein
VSGQHTSCQSQGFCGQCCAYDALCLALREEHSTVQATAHAHVDTPFELQELSNILESLASQRANSGGADEVTEMAADMEEAAEDDEDHAAASAAAVRSGLLQTFVFSATLTLPQKLRKRLRRGACAVTPTHPFNDAS